MTVRLFAGHCDLTDQAQGITWTTSDPGGFETATFQLPNTDTCPTPGAPILITEGLNRVFMGRVEEPSDNFDPTVASGQVSGVGAGAAAKDGTDFQMVFIDRDLSRWQGPSRQRIANYTSGVNVGSPSVLPDASTGAPALHLQFEDAWTTVLPTVEAWYDAGFGNALGRIRSDWAQSGSTSFSDTTWSWAFALSTDDVASTIDSTGDVSTAATGSIDQASAGGGRRFALINFTYPSANAGVAGAAYSLNATNLRVFGNHGLTIRGSTAATEGFYPDDIAAYAMSGVKGVQRGVVQQASSYIVPHLVYYTPVTREKVILDMAGLMGWHYGVWEPLSLFDDTPRWDFRPPPTDATAIVMRSECQQLRLSQRLSDFHDTAIITYTDAAGIAAAVTVFVANPRIPAELSPRSILQDIGQSTAAIAAQFGADLLALEQQQTRAAGTVELPPYVRTATGGPKASHLLKPGIDRLKIIGLPNSGYWTDPDTNRFDTFHISRLTCQVQQDGSIQTTAELDSGATLIEVLQARLAVDAGIAG